MHFLRRLYLQGEFAGCWLMPKSVFFFLTLYSRFFNLAGEFFLGIVIEFSRETEVVIYTHRKREPVKEREDLFPENVSHALGGWHFPNLSGRLAGGPLGQVCMGQRPGEFLLFCKAQPLLGRPSTCTAHPHYGSHLLWLIVHWFKC